VLRPALHISQLKSYDTFCIISNEIEEELIYRSILTRIEMTVDGKDRVEIPKNSKKAENLQPSFKHVVSEGSIVVLDARDLIKDKDTTNSIKNYSWKQTTDIHLNTDSVKDRKHEN
jgi:hypothetical protein